MEIDTPEAKDVLGAVVRDGDLLLGDRGIVWIAQPTENSLLRQGVMRAAPRVRARVSARSCRVYHTFLLSRETGLLTRMQGKALYAEKYRSRVRARGREAVATRRATFARLVERRRSEHSG